MKNYKELILSINEKANAKIIQRKRQKKVFLLSSLSFCIVTVIAIGTLNLAPQFLKSNTESPLNTPPPVNVDKSFNGLVVNNFKLSDIQADGVNAQKKLPATKLSDFFSYNSPDMFVFVRVFETKQWLDKKNGLDILKQTSSAYVISNLWSKNADIPQTLTITQTLYGGCMGDEETNMLRKDGVYLLPLSKGEEDENWHVGNDLDVLFEVDNNKKIWSHSSFEKLSFYDGKDVDVLSEDIAAMTSNENFPSVISSFGQIARNWGVVVQAKILSVNKIKDEWGFDCFQYTFEDFNILSKSEKMALEIENKEATAISYAEENTALASGGEYLLILDYSENGPFIENDRVAIINEDKTISPISNDTDNIFARYNGYMVEQMKNEAERAKEWQREFGDQ